MGQLSQVKVIMVEDGVDDSFCLQQFKLKVSHLLTFIFEAGEGFEISLR